MTPKPQLDLAWPLCRAQDRTWARLYPSYRTGNRIRLTEYGVTTDYATVNLAFCAAQAAESSRHSSAWAALTTLKRLSPTRTSQLYSGTATETTGVLETRPDWETSICSILTDLLWQHFLDAQARALLLATGEREIWFTTPARHYLAGLLCYCTQRTTGRHPATKEAIVTSVYEGHNHLGGALEQTRRDLRKPSFTLGL